MEDQVAATHAATKTGIKAKQKGHSFDEKFELLVVKLLLIL